jgi:hypothetical protein
MLEMAGTWGMRNDDVKYEYMQDSGSKTLREE